MVARGRKKCRADAVPLGAFWVSGQKWDPGLQVPVKQISGPYVYLLITSLEVENMQIINV